ncbi:hypothetical protein LY78DRAFT_658153 [Colletotrichum sublineola]|nr:hypothetical protein LY78DRAFT_658153 [Colletotrichum sublineola]
MTPYLDMMAWVGKNGTGILLGVVWQQRERQESEGKGKSQKGSEARVLSSVLVGYCAAGDDGGGFGSEFWRKE